MTDPRLALPQDAKLAVLGSPIGHSKSPAIHAAAYRELGVAWQYRAHELTAPQLAGFLDERDSSWRGLSLTMPLKEEAHRLATVLDPITHESGVVNTLLRVTGTGASAAWAGFNTDVGGLAAAIRLAELDATQTIVLGAGATAVSAILAARALGAQRVTVLARRPEAAQLLVEKFHGTAAPSGDPLEVTAAALYAAGTDKEQAAIRAQYAGTTLVISTLPAHGIDWDRVPTVGLAATFDVAYDPWPSALASATAQAGAPVYSGVGMLIEQALLQIRIFVNGDPALPLATEPALREAMRGAAGM